MNIRINGYNCIREMLEAEEAACLSRYAALSSESLGRDREEPQDDMRPVYQRDRDRILHCKSFRRLKHKTQVFLAPEGDHYRTRLTHTLEVSQIARSIARALRLNESLTEAIALGHDLGHTPFGHSGEAMLNKLCTTGFVHSEQSVRICEVLEKGGRGLNLTAEVRDGIRNHRTSGKPATLEGQTVRLSDKIAYLNHDIDDAIRAGLLREEDIPHEFRDILGSDVHSRLDTLINNVIFSSLDSPRISMSPEIEGAMQNLRSWMFENIYIGGKAKEEEGKAKHLIEMLFLYYMDHPEMLSPEYLQLIESGETRERAVCDYISGMTDNYAIEKFEEIFVPIGWKF
ncbi:MAG: deoxyguanosinetriphosphate triphosphohydrolase [Clostridiales bacterium]|nr:deoxyguanosinetriphosphate triphosphohydrolase [Clostridiales bacterium]MDO5140515.1 deoxyguanosinetriphosphate triphosphohydrolase [Eubacteriales bacterium]